MDNTQEEVDSHLAEILDWIVMEGLENDSWNLGGNKVHKVVVVNYALLVRIHKVVAENNGLLVRIRTFEREGSEPLVAPEGHQIDL